MKSGATRRFVLIAAVAIAALVLGGVVAGRALAQGATPGGYGGMMGGYGGMMGGYYGAGSPSTNNGQRLSMSQVQTAVSSYLGQRYNNPDLVISEIMEFQNNFYAQVKEQSTAISAFELLIDPYSGQVWPEYGPNMMWNTKYGMMGGQGGVMGRIGGMTLAPALRSGASAGVSGLWGGAGTAQVTADMPVKAQQAVQDAQKYLDAQGTGLTAEQTPDTFYGYYTLHTLNKDGTIQGMLSVNGYTGQVWYHTWHGSFITMNAEQAG